MIRSLRRKFILIAIASLLGTFAVLCAFILGSNYLATAKRSDAAILALRETNGALTPPAAGQAPPLDGGFRVTAETPFEIRYFVIMRDSSGQVLDIDDAHIAALDRGQIVETAEKIGNQRRRSGYIGHYRFGVFDDEGGGTTIIVLDCYQTLQLLYANFGLTLVVSLICILAATLLIIFFSSRAIRPFVENMERQRQFVTDASHELKTPLTIIAANNSLLALTLPDNKWVKSTQDQVSRMNRLLRNLIELARTEESVADLTESEFSLSAIACSQTDAFTSRAQAAGLRLETAITDGLRMCGIEENIFRLFALLLDNAVKYCTPGGTITLALRRKGRNFMLTVNNPCTNLSAHDIPRLFDRFYRADRSRARSTGGYGIGLSTARAIAEQHHGSISAKYDKGTVTFTVLLPCSRSS